MKNQKLCPRCGTPMLEFNVTWNDGVKNGDWHCPTHGKQITVSTNLNPAAGAPSRSASGE